MVVSDVDSRASENWILDSGCMFHMTPNWDWLSTYEHLHKGAVLMGENASCKVVGIGIICDAPNPAPSIKRGYHHFFFFYL